MTISATTSRTRRPVTELEKTQAMIMAACGMSFSIIGNTLERSNSTVRYWLLSAEAEAAKERAKQQRLADPELCRRRMIYWRANNPEKDSKDRCASKERMRKLFVADPTVFRSRSRKWAMNNRKYRREQSRKRSALRRTGRLLALVPLTQELWRERSALFDNRCAYCGTAEKPTVDHVLALTAGGLDEPDNVVPACTRCNCSKKTSSVESWYRAQPFFTEARWQQIVRHCPTACGQLGLGVAA